MSRFHPFLILTCMLCKTVVSQVSIVPDKLHPTDDQDVQLTCNLTPFALLASWINNATGGILTSCPPSGPCTIRTSGRYNFSATASTIVVVISHYNATIDNFGWKCRHNSTSDVFIFTPATTTTTSSTTTATTITMTTTEKTTSTEETTSTEKTTNTGMGTQSTIATSSCPLPVLVITGISVSGFLSILLIFIICCCCPCCCLYHCTEDYVKTNDNEDVNNHIKENAGTPNPAYVQKYAPNELGAYDKLNEVQFDDGTLKELVQSNRLATNPTNISNKERENKPIPNKNEVIVSEQL